MTRSTSVVAGSTIQNGGPTIQVLFLIVYLAETVTSSTDLPGKDVLHYRSFPFYRSCSVRKSKLRMRTRHPRIISHRVPCGHHSFAPVTAIYWSGSPASKK